MVLLLFNIAPSAALQATEAFQRDPPTTMVLLSMRCARMVIDLTSATHVFLLEPALSPALEEQAIGRAWRMSLQRQVHVKKLYIKVSVMTKCQPNGVQYAYIVRKSSCPHACVVMPA